MASRQRAPTSKPSDLFDDDVDQEHDQFEIMDDDEFMQRSVEDLRQRHAELRDALKAIGSSQRKAKLNVSESNEFVHIFHNIQELIICRMFSSVKSSRLCEACCLALRSVCTHRRRDRCFRKRCFAGDLAVPINRLCCTLLSFIIFAAPRDPAGSAGCD